MTYSLIFVIKDNLHYHITVNAPTKLGAIKVAVREFEKRYGQKDVQSISFKESNNG